MIHKVPTATLDDYSNELFDRFGLTVKKSRLSKILKEINFSHKKVQSMTSV